MPDVNLYINSNILDVKKGVDQTTQSTAKLEQETKDYEKASQKAFGQTADDLKDTRQEMDRIQPATAKLSSLFKTLGTVMAGAFSVTAIVAFTKQVLASTQTTADAMEKFKEGSKQAMEYLMRAIATVDFSHLINGFRDAFEEGKRYAEMMDLLGDRRRSLEIQRLEIEGEIIVQRTNARNRQLDLKDREAAINKIIGLEKEKMNITKQIADEALQNELDNAAQITGLRQEQIRDFISNERDYEARLEDGKRLTLELQELMRMVMAFPESDQWSQEYYDFLNGLTEAQKANIEFYKSSELLVDEKRDPIRSKTVEQMIVTR